MLPNKRVLWKTSTVIIFSTIIMAAILFITIVSVISSNLGKQIERVQQETFNQATEAVKDSIVSDPTLAGLDPFIRKGYKISVFNTTSKMFIYPKALSSWALDTKSVNISLLEDSDGYLTTFTVGNKQVSVGYPVQLQAPEIKMIVLKSIPILLVMTLIIVAIIAGLYIFLYRNEKNKLNKLFHLTEKRVASETISETDFGIRVKDYAIIEKQVKALYDSLETSNNKMQQEMLLVKELERANVSLLQGITHEMKTPLMSTKLLIGQLQTQIPNNETIPSVLQQMTNLERLIHEVLFVTQKKYAGKEDKTIFLSTVLQQTLEKYDVLLDDKDIHVDLIIEAEFQMKFDIKLIEKILSNLLSNAIHYTNEHTIIRIVITADSFTMNNPITNVNIINMENIGKPFVSFGPSGGTGLGLYLIKMMLLNYPYELKTHINDSNMFVAKINKLE